MSDRLLNKFIGEVVRAKAEHAEGAMQFPKQDLFGYGFQCGAYQGLTLALEILEAIIQEGHKADLKK